MVHHRRRDDRADRGRSGCCWRQIGTSLACEATALACEAMRLNSQDLATRRAYDAVAVNYARLVPDMSWRLRWTARS